MFKAFKIFVLCMLMYSSAQGKVYHVAQSSVAKDTNPGTEELPFRTINKAASLAAPGDTVLVYPGVYRECVQPARGGVSFDKMITYKATQKHQVFVRGSELVDLKLAPLKFKTRKSVKPFCFYANIPKNIFKENPRLKGKIFNPFKTIINVCPYMGPEKRYVGRVPGRKDFPELVLAQVYVRGIPLKQVRTIQQLKAERGSFCVIGAGDRIAINFHPYTQGSVEIAVRQQAFVPKLRGLDYIKVEGFVFEQAANPGLFPQMGMVSTRSGSNWIIKDNIIRHAGTVGLDVGGEIAGHWTHIATKKRDIAEGQWVTKARQPRWEQALTEGKVRKHHLYYDTPQVTGHQIRNNHIYANGLSGIIAVKTRNILIENNLIEYNNRRQLTPSQDPDVIWEEAAGIKLHLSNQAVIRHNLIRKNYGEARGIWLDLQNKKCVIDSNIVLDNEFGIDLEAKNSYTVVSNNIVAFNRINGLSHRTADGVLPVNSTDAFWVNNLVAYNGNFGYAITAGKKQPTHITVDNNIFTGNHFGAMRLLFPANSKKNYKIKVNGNVVENETMVQLMPAPPAKITMTAMLKSVKDIIPGDSAVLKRMKGSNYWWAGQTDINTFDKILKGKNFTANINAEIIMKLVSHWHCRPERYPDKPLSGKQSEYVALKLGKTQMLQLKTAKSARVVNDYFGRKRSDMTLPGPFSAESLRDELIAVWPLK